jgi:hypothetical protein
VEIIVKEVSQPVVLDYTKEGEVNEECNAFITELGKPGCKNPFTRVRHKWEDKRLLKYILVMGCEDEVW